LEDAGFVESAPPLAGEPENRRRQYERPAAMSPHFGTQVLQRVLVVNEDYERVLEQIVVEVQ